MVDSDAPARYEYFIKRVADWEEVWGLRDERGLVVAHADQGRALVPVWPHARYARECAVGNWEGAEPDAMDLGEWLDSLTASDATVRGIAVFPLRGGHGIAVEPDRLRRDIEGELTLYE